MFTNKKLEDDLDCKAIFPQLFKVEKVDEKIIVAAITISQPLVDMNESRTFDSVSVVLKMEKLKNPTLESKDVELFLTGVVFMCENMTDIIMSEGALNLNSVNLKLGTLISDWRCRLLLELKKVASFSSTPAFHKFDSRKEIKFKIDYNYENIKKVIGYIA